MREVLALKGKSGLETSPVARANVAEPPNSGSDFLFAKSDLYLDGFRASGLVLSGEVLLLAGSRFRVGTCSLHDPVKMVGHDPCILAKDQPFSKGHGDSR